MMKNHSQHLIRISTKPMYEISPRSERRIVPFFRNLGHDVKVVAVDFPPDISDHAVLAYTYKEQRILITKSGTHFRNAVG